MRPRCCAFRGRLFIFECKLTASVCPITFGDTKEGSFGVRVNDAMRTEIATGGTVTSADGTVAAAPAKDNLPVWGKLADWHDEPIVDFNLLSGSARSGWCARRTSGLPMRWRARWMDRRRWAPG